MRCYVYLSHRDKKGIKLLGTLDCPQQIYQKINNISDLNLSKDVEKDISNTVFENRMKWDLWIETAKDYVELENKLKNRGFRELPRYSTPAYNFTVSKVKYNTNYTAQLKKSR